MAIYIGPDQVMPVSSVLGTLVGLILLFWNKLAVLFSRITGRTLAKPEVEEPAPSAGTVSQGEEPHRR